MSRWCPHDDDPQSCPPCRHEAAGTTPAKTLTRTRAGAGRATAAWRSTCQACGFSIVAGDALVLVEHTERGETVRTSWVHEACGGEA